MIVLYFTGTDFTSTVTAYNKTAANVEVILAPSVTVLNNLAIPFTVT